MRPPPTTTTSPPPPPLRTVPFRFFIVVKEEELEAIVIQNVVLDAVGLQVLERGTPATHDDNDMVLYESTPE